MGNPCASDDGISSHGHGQDTFITTSNNDYDVTIYKIGGFPDSSDDSTDSEFWKHENNEDPWPLEKIKAEQEEARQDPSYLTK